MTKDSQTQQRKATTSKEVSEARALWRARKVTKPEYARFCNQIHLLELQASKEDMDKEKARRIKQTLLADLDGSGRKSAAARTQAYVADFRDRLGEDNITVGSLLAE